MVESRRGFYYNRGIIEGHGCPNPCDSHTDTADRGKGGGSMILQQSQQHELKQWQVLHLNILQMSATELDSYLQELEQSNPLVERDGAYEVAADPLPSRMLDRLAWLEDDDYQNRYYQSTEEERADPLSRMGDDGGLDDTLERFLARQIQRLRLDEADERALLLLAAHLDEDGYLRQDLDALSALLHQPRARLEALLPTLQSLDPAGVGARDLAECLTLQLQRLGYSGAPVTLVQTCLERLAKHQYRSAAQQLDTSVETIHQWEQIIRSLDPRPGAAFQKSPQAAYLYPDVVVEDDADGLHVRLTHGDRAPFRINAFYKGLLSSSNDPAVHQYVSEKLQQAQQILQAVADRDSTLLRCMEHIVAQQADFFRQGPKALKPLRLADVAQALSVHPSTVSRAIREKYLQCSSGAYPISYLFSGKSSQQPGDSMAAEAARRLLRELIEQEDKAAPLSDQQLCALLAQRDCVLSRRTVAKYREQLQIPCATGRKRG